MKVLTSDSISWVLYTLYNLSCSFDFLKSHYCCPFSCTSWLRFLPAKAGFYIFWVAKYIHHIPSSLELLSKLCTILCIESLNQRKSSYIWLQVFDILMDSNELAEKLAANTAQFRSQMTEAGFTLGVSSMLYVWCTHTGNVSYMRA